MKYRTKLAGALALAATMALTACGGGGGGGGAAQSGEVKGEITYGVWGENQIPAMEKMIEGFNNVHPEVKVSIEHTPFKQYWTKLQTQGSSSTLPDVFWMNGPNIRLYASNGLLAPIEELEKAGKIDTSKYPEAMNNLYSHDGKQYAVPKDFDTIGLWYNKALFAKAGVQPPTDDWTWDDFKNASAEISKKLKADGVYGAVADVLGSGQGSYYNSILQAGGEVISEDGKKSGYDSPEAIRGLELWRDLIKEGSMPSIKQLADTAATTWFESGKAAMFWSGTFSVRPISQSAVAKDVTVVALPKDERAATVIHGVGNVMAAKTDNKPAAEAFLAYLGGEEANVIQAESGTANPAYLEAQTAYIESQPGFNLQVFETAAEKYAFPYPISNNTAAWNDLEKSLLPQAFSGERPVEEVAKELATKMNELLAKE